jgi:hypothetical protein
MFAITRRHFVRSLALAAVLVTPAALGGCAAMGKGPREEQPRTYVVVQNQSWLDMTVYVLRSSQRVRIGTATGNGRSRLLIPSNMLFGPTPLSFMVDPVGRNSTARSFEIVVTPGEEVSLTIPPGA